VLELTLKCKKQLYWNSNKLITLLLVASFLDLLLDIEKELANASFPKTGKAIWEASSDGDEERIKIEF